MKRIISLLLTMALLLTTWGCNSNKTEVSNNSSEYITRASWVENVGKYFGMTDYLSETPYFSDITSSSPIFAYVQSCYEWGAISTDSENFNPDDVATLGFAVCSAVMIIKGGEAGLTNDDLLNYAVDNKLITADEREKSLNSGITGSRANELVVAAETIYLTENIEVINELTVAEDVENYTDVGDKITYVAENEYIMDATIAEGLEINDIIAVSGNDGVNEEVAVKVSSKEENSDGTYTVTTVQPELSEVFSEINIQGTRYADYDQFVPVEGVTVTPLEPEASTVSFKGMPSKFASTTCVTTVDSNGKPINVADGDAVKSNFELSVTLNSKGEIKPAGEMKFENDYFELSLDDEGKLSVTDKDRIVGEDVKVEYEIPDANDKDLKALSSELGIDVNEMIDTRSSSLIEDYRAGILKPKDLKSSLEKAEERKEFSKKGEFESGWEITGTVAVKNLAITPDIKFGETWWGTTNVFDFKKASVRVTGEIVNSLTVKGELSGEKKIGDLPFQTPVPGLSINLQFFVYFEANGELTVTTKVALDNKIEVKKGTTPKITNNTTLENSIEAKLELEAGVAAGVAIYILGFDVFSLRAKVGIGGEISGGYARSGTITETEDSIVYTETYKITGDGGIYFPLIKIEVNQTKGNILGKLGLKVTKDITTKDSIKEGDFGKYISFYGDEGYEHIVLQRIITIDLKDEEETEVAGDYLLLSDIAISMGVGESYNITIENLPLGYTAEDVVWSVVDSSVASVSGGTVSANTEGSTVVTATTSDGKYTSSCNVIVAK